ERFEDLEVWKIAFECANLIYDVTSVGKFSQDYVLRDQIRRAGISIFSNIAEGFERDGNREFANFLKIAKGSCGAARAQAIFAFHRNYISEDEFNSLTGKLIQTNKQISGFRSYLNQTEMKGRKFF
ncbi:MAG TPA: four helix bundle protein, partial [Pyrinomonadaceae bacterium]|nr:four helix bundle protein [Pyrinomonadaceae bacterium]